MTKIQSTTRRDETTIYSIYLPSNEVKEAGLHKGDEVIIECTGPGKLEVTKQ